MSEAITWSTEKGDSPSFFYFIFTLTHRFSTGGCCAIQILYLTSQFSHFYFDLQIVISFHIDPQFFFYVLPSDFQLEVVVQFKFHREGYFQVCSVTLFVQSTEVVLRFSQYNKQTWYVLLGFCLGLMYIIQWVGLQNLHPLLDPCPKQQRPHPIMTFRIVMEDPPSSQICRVLATLRNDNNWHIWWITWLFQHHHTQKSNICGLNKRVWDWLTWSTLRAFQPPWRQL